MRKSGVLVSLLPVLLLGASCSRNTPPAEPPVSVKKELSAPASEIWTCSMHPQVRQNGPGKCPICGMDLVKVTAAVPRSETHSSEIHFKDERSPTEPQGHSGFQLSAERQQMIGVKTGVVERRLLFKHIRASGRVAFDPELYTAQSEYREALQQLERVKSSPLADVRHSAERMKESAKLRLKILGLSDPQIAGLAKSKESDPGLLLHQPGEDVWVYAEVPEMDLTYITPGLEAEIVTSSSQGRKLKGKVASVDRILNPSTRTARVRIEVPKAKPLLRPESYVDVTLFAPLGQQTAIPFDAVLDTGTEAWAFLAKPDGHFEPRSILIKFRADDWIAVEQGLSPGDSIVTSANFLVDSESRLRSAALAGAQPGCPAGQAWDSAMAMCMPKAAEK